MIQRERRGPRVVAAKAAALVLCSMLLGGSSGASSAADLNSGGIIRIGAGMDVSGLQDIAVSDIVPGYRESWSVTVVNQRAEPVTVGLRVVDLVNDDNGCSAPEAREDDDCGDGEGELGEHLTLLVGTPENSRLFSAVLNEADEGSGQIITVPANNTAEVLVGFLLPAGTGNVVQTDSAEFTLLWRAEALLGTRSGPVEGGAEVRSNAAGSSEGSGLAATGAKVMLLVGLAVALLAGGALLILLLWRDDVRGSRRLRHAGGPPSTP